jgi:membrane protein required for colicin V production
MNLLDIIIIIPVLWGMYKGYRKGLIIELASLAALLGGIYAAIHFSDNFTTFLKSFLDLEDKYINIIAFALTFFVVVIIVMFVAKILDKIISAVMLGFVNRIIGTAFGVVKAVILLSFLILLIEIIDDNQKLITAEKKDNSLLYRPVASVAPVIISFVKDKEVDISEIELRET